MTTQHQYNMAGLLPNGTDISLPASCVRGSLQMQQCVEAKPGARLHRLKVLSILCFFPGTFLFSKSSCLQHCQ